MGWIIVSYDDGEQLRWSNDEGFTESDNFETFTDEERETFTLPIGGEWVQVPWKADRDA